MPRLILVFAGRTGHFVGFVMRRLIYYIPAKICIYTSSYRKSSYHATGIFWFCITKKFKILAKRCQKMKQHQMFVWFLHNWTNFEPSNDHQDRCFYHRLIFFFWQVIENISTLTNLTSLFMGKNKLTKIQGLDTLTQLRTLSIQVNSWAPSRKAVFGVCAQVRHNAACSATETS